jgi:hypothetical protein
VYHALLEERPHRPALEPKGAAARLRAEAREGKLDAASTRHVAPTLQITPKTAGNHIERIDAKIGASSRSTATLYAMQHGMLATLEPVQP